MTGSAHASMPVLSAQEKRHSHALSEFLRERIRAAGGRLSFEQFMEIALYAPGLGYYSAGSAKIGADGDFVTAPEVSDLFSRCLARQCAEVLAQGGGEILELGAGTGRMAAVILETLAELGRLPDRYAILEVSADLAERQRGRLAGLPTGIRERVVWLERLPERPQRGIILANEVLDALPFHRVVLRGGRVLELGVGLAAEGTGAADDDGARTGNTDAALAADPDTVLVESEAPPSDALARAWEDVAGELRAPLPDGYRTELCLRTAPWIASIADCLERGVLLLFDYGLPRSHFYHPQRVDGTLLCHFKQRAHGDPFANLGVQDITAWVDFTGVAEAAVEANLEVLGFATQAAFLLANGIEQLASAAPNEVERVRLAGEARRLMMPGEMGEAFKVMALGRKYDAPLSGFGVQDLRRLL
jgi:SAM-dependent MidA family methyltransferase